MRQLRLLPCPMQLDRRPQCELRHSAHLCDNARARPGRTKTFPLDAISFSSQIVQDEIGRSAATRLLDEGIDQYLGMNRTCLQRALRTLLQESEYQGIANAADPLIRKRTFCLSRIQLTTKMGAPCPDFGTWDSTSPNFAPSSRATKIACHPELQIWDVIPSESAERTSRRTCGCFGLSHDGSRTRTVFLFPIPYSLFPVFLYRGLALAKAQPAHSRLGGLLPISSDETVPLTSSGP
jgi:hypothetical protein